MNKTKVLSLILALIMVCSLAVVGCKDDGAASTGAGGSLVAGTADEVDPNSVYDAEVKNLNGHEFWFLVRTTKHAHLNTNEVYAEELTGDKVNDAVFKRNSSLETTYNCKIYEERVDNPATSVKESLIAGEYQYDYIYTSISTLRSLAASNLIVDLNTLENLDLDKTWWDQNARAGLNIAGKLYYGVGDAGTLDDRSTWIMLFNKDYIELNKQESPYTLVSSGNWTIQKMLEIMSNCVQDKDGNGVMDFGKDVFGYIGEEFNNWAHVAACNCTLSTYSTAGDIYIPPMVNEKVLSAWADLKPLLTSPYRDVSDAGTRFRNGLGVFFGINAGAILNYTEATVNFGIVPFPKQNAEQEEYWTTANAAWLYGYAIPTTTDSATDAVTNGFASGREQAAYFLEAFAYQSVDTLTVAFYDQVLKRQVVRDAESSEMIDLALKNKIYDPIVLYSFAGIGNVFRQCGSNGSGGSTGLGNFAGSDVNYDTLVSTYESRLTAARKALNNFLTYISVED